MLIQQEHFETLPVGEYPAVLTAVEPEEGLYGLQLKFVFTINEGERRGTQLFTWTSARFGPKSKLYALAKALFNAAIPAEYDLNTDDLIGRKASLTVVIKTKDDGTEFNRIEAVRPLVAKQLNGASWRPAPPSPDAQV